MQDNNSVENKTPLPTDYPCGICSGVNTTITEITTSNGHLQWWLYCDDCEQRMGPVSQNLEKPKWRKPVSIELRKERMNLHGQLRCMVCLFEVDNISILHAHHIVPVEDGGADTLENIIMVCNLCHTNWHNRQALTKRAAL